MDTDPAKTIKPVYSVTRFLDQNGVPYGINHANGKPSVSDTPYLYDIALGNLPGREIVNVSGRNLDVDNAVEDIWEVGGSYVFPPAGGIQLSVQSTSAADTLTGTGVRVVDIEVLLSDYTEKSIALELNGLTPVLTTETNILRINGFHAMVDGSGGVAAGNIMIKNVAQTIVYSMIVAGLNVQRQAIYTVPAGKSLYITAWKFYVGASASGRYAEFLLRATFSDVSELLNIFHVKDEASYVDGGNSIILSAPIKIGSMADIKISTVSDAANANTVCIAGFSGWLE